MARKYAPTVLSPHQERIWDAKYRLKAQDKSPVDLTVEDTWRRVANAVAEAEKFTEWTRWCNRFYDAMHGFKLLPAGRILVGAGTDRNVTLSNCFVLGTIPDSMDGIFSALREAALTLQTGGGIGYDFSTLRYKGAPVHGVGADASGPVSFMDVWHAMCETLMGAGSRRGAMMGTLRCDHPDIMEFIQAKRTEGRLTNFNLSVLATDKFKKAVDDDLPWQLTWNGEVVRELPARELWDAIMRLTYEFAEPGVIFIDRVNERNNLRYIETINATNPCGEQPLPPYGACVLSSINLAALVRNPFTDRAGIDIDELNELTSTAVRFLDDVVDVSRYPLEVQREESLNKRRIGLGITGLADALAMCGVVYGSEAAQKLHALWQNEVLDAAYAASATLAGEKGTFPLYDAKKFNLYLAPHLDPSTKKLIKVNGLRNGTLVSIAPTGTISLFADNVSSGIEPIFSLSAKRRRKDRDGDVEEVVEDRALRTWYELNDPERKGPVPGVFVTAQDLPVEAHLVHLGIAQRYCCTATSKTINLPAETTFEEFKGVYARAYELGAKGCTTYRPSGVRGAVLTPVDEGSDARTGMEARIDAFNAARDNVGVTPADDPLASGPDDALPSRPVTLPGQTYKLRWPNGEKVETFYFMVNDILDRGTWRPFEIFLVSKNVTHFSWCSAFTRMVSAVLRRNRDVTFVAEELLAVFDPAGGAMALVPGEDKPRYFPSLPALIGATFGRHLGELARRNGADRGAVADAASNVGGAAIVSLVGGDCPSCRAANLVYASGCKTCPSCGWSTCG